LRGYAGRGVITTATYEARVFGLHSALGLISGAARSGHVLLPSTSTPIVATRGCSRSRSARIAPEIEDRGIDEIFVDLIVLSGASPRTTAGCARDRPFKRRWWRDRTVMLDRDRSEQAAGRSPPSSTSPTA
jgi:nucleotidyltransferase/DNA polymerase involved in DNA repair